MKMELINTVDIIVMVHTCILPALLSFVISPFWGWSHECVGSSHSSATVDTALLTTTVNNILL